MKRLLPSVVVLLTIVAGCFAQGPTTVVFYNLENLFDTVDTRGVRDGEFTPRGSKRWTSARYARKLTDIAHVLSDLAAAEGGFPVVIGVAEVENRAVMEALAAQPALLPAGYRVVHFDSPDPRGIDVGFLYRPDVFDLQGSAPVRVAFPEARDFRTRDLVTMWGTLDAQPFFFLVCHWPSRVDRRGDSEHRRMTVARRVRHVADSVLKADSAVRVVVMGDLNDDPIDRGVIEGLRSVERMEETVGGALFNPFAAMYLAGYGSLAYRGEWNLFDQVLVSHHLTGDADSAWRIVPVGGTPFYGGIFCRPYQLQTEGHFRGYPFRTYAGDEYLGGVSDHLPVYIRLECLPAPDCE